ncbi:MAG: hypothetical protein AAF998_27520 [Bacteroidota bacterium]
MPRTLPTFLPPGRSIGLAFILLLLTASLASAQNSAWDGEPDEDDETSTQVVDEAAWDVPAGKHDDAVIRLNGEDFPMTDDLEVMRRETLDVKVRYLKPGSAVIIKMQKGGIALKRKVFYCNEKGQLDLEVRTGKKRVSGNAVLYYIPSNGIKKERKVHIAVK